MNSQENSHWQISEYFHVTCFLRVFIIQFASLVSLADTQMGEEVDKEWAIEILTELVENKPGNNKK